MLFFVIANFIACSDKAETIEEPVKKVKKTTDWKVEFEKRSKDYNYASPNYGEFKDQLETCREWFGKTAKTACLADCAVFSLNRFAYNMDHDPQPVEPQVRDQLGDTVCKSSKKSSKVNWKAEFEKRTKDYNYASPNYDEFREQIESCRDWFDPSVTTACLADCAVFSLNRFAYNFDHVEYARPVPPQVRKKLGNNVCKPTQKDSMSKINWKVEFEKRSKDYNYASPNYGEFKDQLETCREWFGTTAKKACLADCAVLSLNRFAYNMDHDPQPVEPQVRQKLGKNICR